MELLAGIAGAAWEKIKEGSVVTLGSIPQRNGCCPDVVCSAGGPLPDCTVPERGWVRVTQAMGGLWSQIRSSAGTFWSWLSSQVQTYVVAPFLDARDQIAAAWGDFSAVIAAGLTSVGQFFFDQVVLPIQEAWTTLVEWFGSTGERIGQALKSGFEAIAGGIIAAFQSTLQGVAGLINKVIGFINQLIRAFNKLRQVASGGQLSNIDEVKKVAVPQFAEGGFVNRPTLAYIGEGGESEYVIPASKMRGAAAAFLSAAVANRCLMVRLVLLVVWPSHQDRPSC